MSFYPLFVPQLDSFQLAAGIALSLVITLISFKLNAISISGACGMIVIGTIVFGLGRLVFAIPLVFFFVSSSILSAIKTDGKKKTLEISAKSGPRDIWQVMANGGIGAVAVIIYFFSGNVIWFFPFLASLCEATSDTWATEIGTLYPDSPVSIVTLRGVEPGQSGGITILGTLGAIGGTLVTMLIAYAASPLSRELGFIDTKIWLVAANCGLAGSLLDSVLGGSLQAQYRCPNCDQLVERKTHCSRATTHIRGLKFVGNDLVNFTCASFAAIIMAVILLFSI